MKRVSGWLAAALLALPGLVSADVGSKLAAFEAEAAQLVSNLPQPNQLAPTAGPRRLVDAQVAFSIGDYDTAALMLFELATRPGPDQEAAMFYLAESQYLRGDRSSARTYFGDIVKAGNVASRYYQPSLVRLIEIAIVQQDDADVADHLAALDRLSAGLRQPSVPYVRGKYAFAQGQHDEAIAYFQEVPKGSGYELQALYYTATVHVAKKDAARAVPIFTDLIARRPRSARDRRVIELSQLALGRLYYELDQMSKSIDAYLLVDRRSDLFPDALYEVAWVYVKGKQYDKALRALELLAQSEPQSARTPTVRLLEGNLRIRKAQLLREAQILGTTEANADTPEQEYEKATRVFADTHAAYHPSYQALVELAGGKLDPAQFLTQLAGRSPSVFQAAMPLPEAAAQALREEPQVQRAVAVVSDLGAIEADIAEAEATIARLSGVLAAGEPAALYPALASRRARLGQIQAELIGLRNQLADQQLALVARSGGVGQASAARQALAQQFAALPNPDQAHASAVETTRASYQEVEDGADEVARTIDQTQAMSVALRVYASARAADGTPLVPADTKAKIATDLDGAVTEAAAIERELAEIRRELTLGRDLAVIGDGSLARARALRQQLAQAQDAEHRQLAAAASGSRDASRSRTLSTLGDRAARLSAKLLEAEQQIDRLVEAGMQQAKQLLDQERVAVEALKVELAELDAEARANGGAALGGSFDQVKARFYDIVIRSDVGTVDVSWSQKEGADDDLKRLNLSRQRELKQLRDEFKDILDAATPTTPATPAPAAAPAPSGSPDQGGDASRVAPGGGAPATPPAPTVRPDNETNSTGGSR